MKETYIDSLGLLKGARVGLFDTTAELDASAGRENAGLDYANKYLAEKGSLVDFRDAFGEKLVTLTGVAMLSRTVTKKYKDGTEEQVDEITETEREYVNRLRKMALAGELADWPTTKDEVEAKLQAVADELGVFNVDASKPVRAEGSKSKQPGKLALQAAENIFKGGQDRVGFWWQKLNDENIVLPALTGDAAVDTRNLARGIKEREDRRKAAEYA